jgi:hypothetical protein
MRVGQNPAKSIDHVTQPERVTVALVTYIPFLSGYYAEALAVLRACLDSLWADAGLPFDLMLFDNASCPEVRAYLLEQQAAGRIQHLILSEHNVGKGGAWNMLFGGAPGEIIAYADSDIRFFPGWLAAEVAVLDRVPQAGMVTGMPMWSPAEFSTAIEPWLAAHPEADLERGQLLAWEDFWRHSRSLGADEAKARAQFAAREDLRLHYQGADYWVGAGHFQFAAPKAALQRVLPLPSQRPMGQVRSLDVALNELGYLRLATPAWWVQHMGNTLPADLRAAYALPPTAAPGPTRRGGFWGWKPARRLLTWVYGRAFNILYRG